MSPREAGGPPPRSVRCFYSPQCCTSRSSLYSVHLHTPFSTGKLEATEEEEEAGRKRERDLLLLLFHSHSLSSPFASSVGRTHTPTPPPPLPKAHARRGGGALPDLTAFGPAVCVPSPPCEVVVVGRIPPPTPPSPTPPPPSQLQVDGEMEKRGEGEK